MKRFLVNVILLGILRKNGIIELCLFGLGNIKGRSLAFANEKDLINQSKLSSIHFLSSGVTVG
jgi:hypothetical protein